MSGQAPGLVQSAGGAAASGSSSATVSFNAASSAGDTIVLFARFGGAISGVTDNQAGGSNAYTSVLGPTRWGVAPNPTDREAQVFIAKNIQGGAKLTVTVQFEGSSNHTVYLAAVEYSGVDPLNPVNAAAVGTGTVSQNGAPKTSNLSTTVANAKLVATSEDSNESYTSTGNGAGYTTDAAASLKSISGGSGWPSLTEDMTAPAPGTWNASASSAPAVDDWVILLIALAPAPGQTVTADTNGNYAFNNVNNGTYTVVPSQSGSSFTPPSQTVTVNGASVSGVNFSAAGSTGTISGTVINSSGAAISGATVSYSGGSANTGSNGSYTLSDVPPGTISLTAAASGYQSSTQNVVVSAGATSTHNFTLAPAVTTGAISGNVRNTSGTAISGATVSGGGGSTSTGTDGSYTLSNIPAGTVSLTAAATGYQSSTQNVVVSAGGTSMQNFTLSASTGQGFSIQGAITPASIGAGAAVALSGSVPVLVQSAPGSAVTGSTVATFAFGAPSRAGDTIILFVRFGGTTISSVTDNQPGGSDTYSSVSGPTHWGVAPESTDRWAQVFVAKNITGGSTLTIKVQLAGTSTHDTYIAALEYSGVDPVNPVNATTVATGTVSQNGAPATGNLTTTVANAELVATSWDSNESYTANGNGAGYTTDTAAGISSLSGGSGWPNLTEYRAAPSPGNWNATASSQPAVDQWVIQLIALAPAASQNTTADASGNYTFTNVANGTYTVTPSKSGFTFSPSSQTATVNGANVTGVNFTVNAGAGTISGTVTDPSGVAIGGATVSYSGGSTNTNANGSYTLSNVPAGSVSVTASATGYSSSTQTVNVTANETATQNFVLSPTATTGAISGTVKNSRGTAISGATVSYSGGSTHSDQNGIYTLSNVPTGAVSVTASATGYSSSTRNVTVKASTTVKQNFTLARAR